VDWEKKRHFSFIVLRTEIFFTSRSQLRHPGNYGESAPSGGWACCPRQRSQDIARLAARRAVRALLFAKARSSGTLEPVLSAKLSLKFCHEFAEIRSLKLHA
jgi:hypothetical protein